MFAWSCQPHNDTRTVQLFLHEMVCWPFFSPNDSVPRYHMIIHMEVRLVGKNTLFETLWKMSQDWRKNHLQRLTRLWRWVCFRPCRNCRTCGFNFEVLFNCRMNRSCADIDVYFIQRSFRTSNGNTGILYNVEYGLLTALAYSSSSVFRLLSRFFLNTQ